MYNSISSYDISLLAKVFAQKSDSEKHENVCVCVPPKDTATLSFSHTFTRKVYLGNLLFHYFCYYTILYYAKHVLNVVHHVLNVFKSASIRFFYKEDRR